jgi:copper homeostasis protein
LPQQFCSLVAAQFWLLSNTAVGFGPFSSIIDAIKCQAPMDKKPLLEICVDSAESAIAAQRGGANRVELCSNLFEGGVTPSAGMIAVVRKKISIGLHVMIRPRGGDFLYSAEEFETMTHDLDVAKNLRADAVVLGILSRDGNVDVPRTRELVERARPLSVTFHRAFDMVPNLQPSLEDVIRTGADRILTSGGKAKAEDALEVLAALVEKAGNRITILAGGSIRDYNVKRIIQATGVREVHVGQSGVEVSVSSTVSHRNDKVRVGAVEGSEFRRSVVSEERVRKFVEAL